MGQLVAHHQSANLFDNTRKLVGTGLFDLDFQRLFLSQQFLICCHFDPQLVSYSGPYVT
ncbi:hypothetical protein CBM2634_U480002 [Cupriavidus taiwanensis]|uniref:Uncharacterized protein n=1 Tax=Cupriavidus taiwanensis TaxID=164546 RepID=A0A375JCK9_9BURK|nr:hypothetical protein CBM2634_U480002 [Cupriavidus taiwanensis]